jgi:hypothetical protein
MLLSDMLHQSVPFTLALLELLLHLSKKRFHLLDLALNFSLLFNVLFVDYLKILLSTLSEPVCLSQRVADGLLIVR